MLIKWICEISLFWENNNVFPSQNVGIFAINLTSLLSKDENKFLTLRANDTYVRLIKVLKIQSPNCNPSLKLGYIKLLSSFLNHESGIEYIISTNDWDMALKYCLSNQTVYIIKEGHQFMYDLIEKTANEAIFSDMVIKKILSILYKNHFENGTLFPEIKEEQLKITITPTLQLLSYILERHFQSTNLANKNIAVPSLFLKNNVEDTIWQMVLMVHDADLLFELEKVMVSIYFADLHVCFQNSTYNVEQLKEKMKPIFQLFNMHLSKREIVLIIKLSYWIQYIWHFIGPYCPCPCNRENPLLFENQILIMQTLPLYTIKLNSHVQMESLLLIDEFRDNFVTKIFRIMCEATIRMGYRFRFILMDDDDDLNHAQLAVQYLLKTKKYFKRDACIVCFQCLSYCLKDAGQFTERREKLTNKSDLNKYTNYVVMIIEAVMSFIEDYDFTWTESVETLCVTSTCLDLLGDQNWVPKVSMRLRKFIMTMC